MTSQRLLTAPDEAAALEQLHELGCTDGLPVVIPTRGRVERMIQPTALEPDFVLGHMGPQHGVATMDLVAASAVMAGCLPEHFPLVVAAVKAVSRPEFDLSEIQSTTHNLAPMVIVNGPARLACKVASGFGALGPGHRTNASVGRALRLCLINVGGGRPGVSDMALLGHPGKFTYCLAEAEEESPFSPMHTSRSFSRDTSVVTVVAVEAPHSVLCAFESGDTTSADRLLSILALTIANVASNNAAVSRGSVVVVLNPDHARILGDANYDRDTICRELARRAKNRRCELIGQGPRFAQGDDEISALSSPDDVVLIVAGGTGLYSAVMPSWGFGSHGNRAISEEVDLYPACEIPGAR